MAEIAFFGLGTMGVPMAINLLKAGHHLHVLPHNGHMDGPLAVQYEGPVPSAHGIVRGADAFYLLCESSVECYALDGSYQWSSPLDARPQALLAGEDLFVFAGNLVQRITPPAPEPEAD